MARLYSPIAVHSPLPLFFLLLHLSVLCFPANAQPTPQPPINVPPSIVQPSRFAGYTNDPCRINDDCQSDYSCLITMPGSDSSASVGQPCPISAWSRCRCLPSPPKTQQNCATTSDCPIGERCILPLRKCMSCSTAELFASTPAFSLDEEGDNCPSLSPTPTPPGLRFDPCSTATDCRSGYDCVVESQMGHQVCQANDLGCMCLSRAVPRCTSSKECGVGLRCAWVVATNNTFTRECHSCHAVRYNALRFGFVEREEPDNCKVSLGKNDRSKSQRFYCPENKGLNLDYCCKDGEDSKDPCAFPGTCLVPRIRRPCGKKDVTCICQVVVVRACGADNLCREGEGCFKRKTGNLDSFCASCARQNTLPDLKMVPEGGECKNEGDSDETTTPSTTATTTIPTPSVAVTTASPPSVPATTVSTPSTAATTSENAESTPSPSRPAATSNSTTEEEVCIDSEHLSHVPRTELVFSRDRRAWVLCDGYGSCATSSHVVVYQGETMLMRSYCARVDVKCGWEIKMVNSPRMRRRVRVRGPTSGLEFTALAARWGSVVEERVLRLLVRVGM